MEGIHCERKRYKVPRVCLFIYWLVNKIIDASTEMAKHCHHVSKEVVRDLNLLNQNAKLFQGLKGFAVHPIKLAK